MMMIYGIVPTPPKRAPRTSYGLICVSLLERSVVMIVGPPYISQDILGSKYLRDDWPTIVKLNSNQSYDLLLGSFENGFAEGTFTLPRGHEEKIDGGNSESTKIREFVEETGLFHPQFRHPASIQLFHNFYEEWIGLDNVHYRVDYSVFICNSLGEFIHIERTKPNILKLLYPNVSQNMRKRYRYNNKYDSLKKPINIPIEYLNMFISNNKYQRIVDINVDKIINLLQCEREKK